MVQPQPVATPDYHKTKTSTAKARASKTDRRNLTPDAFKLLLGRRYNRVKRANGERGPQKLDQNDPASTADRLAAEHGVSAATVKALAASFSFSHQIH